MKYSKLIDKIENDKVQKPSIDNIDISSKELSENYQKLLKLVEILDKLLNNETVSHEDWEKTLKTSKFYLQRLLLTAKYERE